MIPGIIQREICITGQDVKPVSPDCYRARHGSTRNVQATNSRQKVQHAQRYARRVENGRTGHLNQGVTGAEGRALPERLFDEVCAAAELERGDATVREVSAA